MVCQSIFLRRATLLSVRVWPSCRLKDIERERRDQIVRAARNHGVEVRPVSINASHWDCTLEPTGSHFMAVRLGFRQVRGLANIHGAAIVGARGPAP